MPKNILVVSDTHGDISNILKYIKETDIKFDLILHLGDYAEDSESLEHALKIPTEKVAGNGDFMSGFADEKLLCINKFKILMTHGHKYNIRFDINNLIYRAEELKLDILLFGHTHKPLNREIDGFKIFNPGSATYPRTNEGIPSLGVIMLDNEGNIETRIEYI